MRDGAVPCDVTTGHQLDFMIALPHQPSSAEVDGIAVDAYVAGDDPTVQQQYFDLAGQIGFSPVDAGSLATSRALEGLAWITLEPAPTAR